MSLAPRGARTGGLARLNDRRPFESPAGLRLIVPGLPQFAWGQQQRGWVLLGSFVVAVLVGLWTWGTWLGWGFLAFAFVAHVTSATDVLRQSSFPIYPSRIALLLVTGVLALLLYLPAMSILSTIARPGFALENGNGFLVNCWAYHGGGEPRQGQWIWMRSPGSGEQRTGQVVAVAGQEVEWNGRRWRVDGKEWLLHTPLQLSAWPQTCRFKVPSNQILVEPDEDGAKGPNSGSLVLVSSDRIIGRAWAHFYPVWDRRLL